MRVSLLVLSLIVPLLGCRGGFVREGSGALDIVEELVVSRSTQFDVGFNRGYEDGYWRGRGEGEGGLPYYEGEVFVPEGNREYRDGYFEGFLFGYDDGYYEGVNLYYDRIAYQY